MTVARTVAHGATLQKIQARASARAFVLSGGNAMTISAANKVESQTSDGGARHSVPPPHLFAAKQSGTALPACPGGRGKTVGRDYRRAEPKFI
jgi:hypothetical protein